MTESDESSWLVYNPAPRSASVGSANVQLSHLSLLRQWASENVGITAIPSVLGNVAVPRAWQLSTRLGSASIRDYWSKSTALLNWTFDIVYCLAYGLFPCQLFIALHIVYCLAYCLLPRVLFIASHIVYCLAYCLLPRFAAVTRRSVIVV